MPRCIPSCECVSTLNDSCYKDLPHHAGYPIANPCLKFGVSALMGKSCVQGRADSELWLLG